MRTKLSPLLLFIFIAGCEAGYVTVDFVWEGGRPTFPEDVAATKTMRVQQRTDPREPGRDLVPPLTLPFSEVDSEIPTVPFGENRVVIGEVRLGEDLAYYGISERFSIHRGEHISVPVFLQPTRPPQPLPPELGASLEIVTSTLAALRGYVNHPNVDLLITAPESAERVRISNVVGLPEGRSEVVALSTLELVDGAPEGYQVFRLGNWNLEQNVDEECLDKNRCRREVFAAFIDRQQYAGPPVFASVILDQVPPTLLAELTSVAPEAARDDSFIVVTLTANEVVREPGLGLAQRVDFPFVRVSPSNDSSSASYTFTSSRTAGSMGRNDAFLIRTTLRDIAGNLARDLEVGTFRVDTVLPAIHDVSIRPSRINAAAGGVVTASFTLNKIATYTVTISGRPMDICAATGRAPDIRVTCERAMRGDEIPDGEERTETLTIDVQDEAGNLARRASDTVVFDFRAPTVTGVRFNPEAAASIDFVELCITADEPLDSAFVPTLEWFGAGAPFLHAPRRDTETERCFEPDPLSMLPGEYLLSGISLRDVAGNETVSREIVDVLPKRWLFDPAAPGIEFLTIYVENGAPVVPPRVPAIAGTTIEVAFEEHELNFASMRVALGSHDITSTCIVEGLAPLRTWICSYVTTGSEYLNTEATEFVVVEVVDLSGNRAAETLPIVFDYAPPALVSVSIAPEAAGLNTTAQLALSISEALAPGFEPVLEWSLPIAFTYDAQLSTTFQSSFRYSVNAQSPAGIYALNRVVLRDIAGNEASIVPSPQATWLLDNVFPIVGPVSVRVPDAAVRTTPPRINRTTGRAVEIQFEVTETNPSFGGTRVTIGALDISSSCTSSGTGPTVLWTCRYVMTGTEPGDGTETSHVVDVRVSDRAANSASGTATILFDFAAPQIVAGSESLQLVPSSSNLLTRLPGPTLAVQALGMGTRAVVGFVLSEPVVPEPAVRALPSALAFQLSNRAGSTFTYEHALTSAPAIEGVNSIQITATDEAGNTAVLALPTPSPGLVVDSRPPIAPDTARLVHTRVPWGSDQAGNGPHAFVEGAAGAVEGDARVVVLGTADLAAFEVLGTMLADAQGAVPRFELDRSEDRSEVFVTVLDGAGNASVSTIGDPLRASRVRGGEKIFTLGGKIPGRRVPNPHDAQMFTGLLPTLAQDQEQTVALTATDFALLSANDGQALHVQTQRRFEPIITPIDQPEPRSHAVMAYDSMRGRAVLFGGSGIDENGVAMLLGDTWEWDGRRWFLVTPLGLPPPARSGASMAFDAARGVVMLFGGASSAGARQDTWTWDGAVWNEVAPAQSPPARTGAGMAYDTTRGHIVLYGGTGAAGNALGDTWIWDGTTWMEEACPQLGPGCPGPRTEMGMSSGSAVFLFGGRNGNTLFNDNWGHGAAWYRLFAPSPAPPLPAGRRGIVYAYDPVRNARVIFGGTTSLSNPAPASSYRNDTWVSAVEINLPATQEKPAARAFAASAFDVRRGELIIFGGMNASGPLSDTWSWDGRGWRDITPSTDVPPTRVQHAMSYDPSSRSIIILGGVDAASSALRPDMWAWNGARWRELAPFSLPADRRLHAMSSSREGVAMFGGTNGQPVPNTLFFWDGTSWSGVVGTLPPCTRPPCPPQPVFPEARDGHAMVFDANRETLVLFGGDTGNAQLDDRTWEWDGTGLSWTARTNNSGIAARENHAMAFDAARGRTVLFGGIATGTRFRDLWEWDGSQWTQANPTGPAPSARLFHAMTYDAARGRVLVYGGQTESSIGLDDAWEWNGTSWVEIGTALPPGPREQHALAFDPERHRAVLFGGVGGDRMAWELDSDPELRPGMRVMFDISELGVDPALLQALEVRAVVGGEGSTLFVPGIGTMAPGGEVGLWNAGLGDWVWLSSNTADLFSPGIASFVVSDAAEIAACFSPGERIYVGARTATGIGNGTSPAELALDNIELRVRYQYPN
jgi:hypothetical protein